MTKKVKASPPIAPPEDLMIFQESPAFSAGAQPQADMPVCWFRQLGLRSQSGAPIERPSSALRLYSTVVMETLARPWAGCPIVSTGKSASLEDSIEEISESD